MTVIEMPAVLTLDAVAAMGEADELHRYELSSDGELKVMMTATPEHARIVMRLVGWFMRHNYSDEQLRTDMGIYTGGGRQPDLTVWHDAAPRHGLVSAYVPVDDLLVAIEVVSPGSRQNDLVDKLAEYQTAGIAQYWTVEHTGTQPVTMHRLGDDRRYVTRGPVPLAWLLRQNPSELLTAP